ncbi:hypothetical protein GCM10007301_26370 [Azorhizobium oxalatiphilum]|uniref:Glycine zipper domain-containing protein n=1 Tax=Azorhizobium oxalatiphilum TaxID=980631 RepID=A0A917FCN5_9HYPH|nr:glycine zipper domain-containing protein [Azorhizobium oxalatiphilum]GGF65338.1 hypothetical protein GCM10007301_26370 [Azorhizobium oxalatiphilum]
MRTRKIAVRAVAAALCTMIAASAAQAQNNAVPGAVLGGITGAVIGGAVTGRAGGAAAGAVIGGATGAVIGSQTGQRPPAYYFWSGGRCHYRYPNGQVVRVSRSYCQ